MSLTKNEWCKMWESIKSIEYALNNGHNLPKAKVELRIQNEIEKIKTQIQSVIGQME